MEQIVLDILAILRDGGDVDDRALVRIVNARSRADAVDKRAYAKRRILPFYQRIKRDDPDLWRSWGVTPELEERFLRAVRMKPRRTASGVATITVITKPWPCSSDCLYCPNDIRMPKSYLHGEPACERAEQNWFDPYLQVSARLTALSQMGHATDKVELIVLGGTWSDYPRAYQIWFVSELFRALNDSAIAGVAANPMLAGWDALPEGSPGAPEGEGLPRAVAERRELYRSLGLPRDEEGFSRAASRVQAAIDAGELSYNRAHRELYGGDGAWARLASMQVADLDELERLQRVNEDARHRVVGLVIETRPDAVTPAALELIRRLGCTKVQMGIQSLDQRILDMNDRGIEVSRIARAFELLRAFGFKIHAHAMVNLLGATPEGDVRDYARLVGDEPFQPDEVKLYPCALIEGARLCRRHERGEWVPYAEDELMGVLAEDVLSTPSFCRISRMIRDFSSHDIIAGNKKPNLRQMVECRLAEGPRVREIRYREVGTGAVALSDLRLDVVPYETSNTSERFLQWVDPEDRIAGFLRLSLPSRDYVAAHADELPIAPGEAMIREVHVYGAVARLGEAGDAAQHQGLGRRLVERACEMARAAGYERINVISAVGTRAYYRSLGFQDRGLYQQRSLTGATVDPVGEGDL
ncbi:MAG: tRNA uridine(34) 5-carboxymethylaminomethyl modification radical SAM/GNAT enzyme Elp3 [Collinsella sp.]|nr:tRNA uridine(34) 5-carboxymethylaminomethyl modification radical SAM/GNAT enzyme Elp3 [Collinsella sp.]